MLFKHTHLIQIHVYNNFIEASFWVIDECADQGYNINEVIYND